MMESTSIEARYTAPNKGLALHLLNRMAEAKEDAGEPSLIANCPEFRNAQGPLKSPKAVSSSHHRMVSPASLYGRSNESKIRREHCSRILHQEHRSVELALITGQSGMGKTSLAVSSLHGKENVKFVKGKFQTRQVAPYAAFSAAMAEILHYVAQSPDKDRIETIRSRIKMALGQEATIVSASIPVLADFLNQKNHQLAASRKSNFMGRDALVRFRNVFCTLMSSVCSTQEPVILFLDDLQWAHKESLELLSCLLTDTSIKGMAIIGACRDNEVAMHDDLAVFLRQMEDNEGLCVTQVPLQGLTENFVATMVSDVFGVPSKNVLPGQPLHTLQLLRALHSHQLIKLCDSSLVLEKGKADKILEEAGRDALQLVSDQISQLPDKLQNWLSVAAFLGADLDTSLITRAVESPCVSFHKCALELGLIQRDGLQGEDNRFRFAHDVVQQASYELVEAGMRDKMHFNIAMRLWTRLKDPKLVEDHSIVIASHLKYGVATLETEQEKVECAELFLLAANRAKLESSFQSAADFLSVARGLLPPRTLWREHYKLSLELYASSAETEFVVGNANETERLCMEIVSNGQSVVDKIPGYSVMMMHMGCRAQMQEALDLGLQVMGDLNETIPRNPSILNVLQTLQKTGGRLQNLNEGDILTLPRMRDPTKVAAMQVLNNLFTYAYGHPTLRVMASGKMIDLTLREGLCAASAVGFAFHAVVLCTSFQRVVEGYRYAQIALKLLEAFGFTEYTARVYTFVYGCVSSAVRPVNDCLGPLEYAHRCGMVSGDTEFAMFALHVYNSLRLYNGTPVRPVFEEALKVRASMIEARQDTAALMHEAFLQAVAGIVGTTAPRAVIGGVTMTRERIGEFAKKEKNTTLSVVLYGNWAVEQFWNGDYEAAAKSFSLARSIGYEKVVMHFCCTLVFFEGMSNFILASESPGCCGSNWNRMRRGRRSLAFLRKHSQVIPANLLHQVQMLEAMQHLLRGNWELSTGKFLLAKERANEMGMIAEEALINELRGRAILRRSRLYRNEEEASSLIRQARDLYQSWGAVQKTRQMDAVLLKSVCEKERALIAS